MNTPIIEKLEQQIKTNCGEIDIEERFNEMLDESYGEINICGSKYQASYALKEMDPTAHRCGMVDYESSEGFIEINGDYYEQDECESEKADLISDLESEISDAEGELEELEEEIKELEEEIEESEEVTDDTKEKRAEIASLQSQVSKKKAEIALFQSQADELNKHSF